MTDIKRVHKEYEFYAPTWRLIRDLIKGERALKMHDLGYSDTQNQDKYIPKPDPTNLSADNTARYNYYVQRASLFNATKRTEQGMGGMVFQKEPIINLTGKLEYLIRDVDGTGTGIDQQAREVLDDILETGNEGLLVDFPQTERALSVSEAASMDIKATINVYKAESILDWRCKKINAASKLSYVKLSEEIESLDDSDIFKSSYSFQYRVLMLDANGNYLQRVYDDKGKQKGEDVYPKNGKGQNFTYIPFFFIGSVNNRAGLDTIPLSEIAELNIKHYRNSADWEESSYIVGQPTPVFSGLNQHWVEEFFKDASVRLGSSAAIPLPVGGSAMLLQASPNSMPEIGMKHKEEQMIALGARLITSGGQAETAEAAMIRHSGDASVLKTIVRNINQGYEDALRAVQEFMSDSSTAEFALNTEFMVEKLQGDYITALVASWQQGVISKEVLDTRLVKGGVIGEDVDLEAMNNEIENTPRGIDLGSM